MPPPSHLALSPFDLYREPFTVIAIADGAELENATFSKRHSANGHAPTVTESNIRSLYQELEDLRDSHGRALTHQVLIFDYEPAPDSEIHMPEGIKTVPPEDKSVTTTIKTIMCDISSLLLGEMTELAKSFEGMTAIETPGHAPRSANGQLWAADDNPMARRNSQFALPSITRSVSSSGAVDKNQSRMSMPVPSKGLPFGSGSPTPTGRPATSARSGLSSPPTTFDDMGNGESGSPERARPGTSEGVKTAKESRFSIQGFGPGGASERWRNKGKGRVLIVVGSMYLQAGRWTDALKELIEGTSVAKSLNDHIWHGKGLELVTVCLFLLGWAGIEFQVPSVCWSAEKSNKSAEPEDIDPRQPAGLRHLQGLLPELTERIIGLYSRMTGEQLPPFPLSETIIRLCGMLSALNACDGKLDQRCLEMLVLAKIPPTPLTTSPKPLVTPSRIYIANLLFKAFPSSTPEMLTTVDRAIILSGISAVLGTVGYHRKKVMVVRELVSVLIGGLVEARTRGAAEVGIHPAAGLVALDAVNGQNNGAGALELGEGDIEYGIDAFLGLLCRTYGAVGFHGVDLMPASKEAAFDDSDAAVIARIQRQTKARSFGMQKIKLNILRAGINFSEALPDFQGVLRFSSDLLRTAGSGVAPGPRREDAAPTITRDEQLRLATNISKTSSLAGRLGIGHIAAEYWDEFLIRGITLDPLPAPRAPVPHAKSVLPGASAVRTSQDVNPFIYNPFVRAPNKAAIERTLVSDEAAVFRVTLQNPYEMDLDIESIKLDTEGAAFESAVESTVIGPYRTQIIKVGGTPREAGALKVTGALVKVRGCRERRFPVFPQPWAADTELKIKGIGLSSLEKNKALPDPGPQLRPESISLNAITAQPLLIVKSTSLPQSAVMVLEGERQVFSVTLQNLSPDTPADLLLFSFQDSTQGPVHTAITNRDATAAELYEYELVLAERQALRHRKVDDAQRYIPPGGTKTFEFEILGKPGLTSGTIQVDYAHLGVPQEEIQAQFHTRQVCLELAVTVNASVELARLDILPIQGDVPKPLWNRLGAQASASDPGSDTSSMLDSEKYCLLVLDLRNAWPSNMLVHLEGEGGFAMEEHILPGNTNRVVFPVPRVYLEDPHASIPALNPSRQRQFVVSTSKITPETERGNRESFWFREKILESFKGSWKTLSGPSKQGYIELRGIRLSPRMIDAVKIDEVGIDISVTSPASAAAPASPSHDSTVYADDFLQVKVRLTNRTTQPIYPTLRLMPALCHRPLNVALDYTRKVAWNGTLQQFLPLLEAHATTELSLGVTALCRGEFEMMASVEETRLWTSPDEDDAERKKKEEGRQRSDTQIMMDALLGAKERRIWHSRHRCLVRVLDREDDD